jgi:hypothetical protein
MLEKPYPITHPFKKFKISHEFLSAYQDFQLKVRGTEPGKNPPACPVRIIDADPDPHVFGPPGSGTGSFCHQAKIVRKTLIPTAL